jgi:hypothetical protein
MVFSSSSLDSPCFAARIASDPECCRDGSSLGFPCRGQPSALVESYGTSLRYEVGAWTLRGRSQWVTAAESMWGYQTGEVSRR